MRLIKVVLYKSPITLHSKDFSYEDLYIMIVVFKKVSYLVAVPFRMAFEISVCSGHVVRRLEILGALRQDCLY